MCKSRRGYLFPAFYYQLLINSCSVLLRLITGISPVLFSTPRNFFNHCSALRLLMRVTPIPSIQTKSPWVCCGVITMQSLITRTLTGIPLINPACGIHSPYKRTESLSMREYVSIPHNRAIHIQRSSDIINLPTQEIAVRKARFTAHQIIAVIRSVESGRTVKDVYREAGISEATRDNWKSGYGGRDTRGITKGSTVFTVCSS